MSSCLKKKGGEKKKKEENRNALYDESIAFEFSLLLKQSKYSLKCDIYVAHIKQNIMTSLIKCEFINLL